MKPTYTRFGRRIHREGAAVMPVVEFLLPSERWTTVEAERSLREMGQTGKRGRKRRQHVDAVAASLLLRAYLDRGIPA